MRTLWLSALLSAKLLFASDAPNNSAFIEPAAGPGTVQTNTVRWDSLARQSILFMGTQHAFRLATEPGTRGASGPYFRSYGASIGRLHGWSDGDPFYVNYVGHPMQGAASGYIWLQNDGNNRFVNFSNTRQYWRSRLRSAGYSVLYSSLFEIGPMSEASIGFIQSRYPQQGLVDHVVTPSIGLGWMIAEDFLDAKVISKLEQRIDSRWVIMLTRGFLNPSRSFANLVRGEKPWHRDTRPGLFTHTGAVNFAAPVEPASAEANDDGVAPFEMNAFGYRENAVNADVNCTGGGASAALRLSQNWQWVAEVAGCAFKGLSHNRSGDSLSYMTGPRWNSAGTRVRPFAQFLFGGRKITVEQVDPVEKSRLAAAKTVKGFTADEYDEFALQNWNNAVAVSAATGVDLRIGRAAALNLASLRYNRSWNSNVAGPDLNTGIQFSFGVMLRMGNW